MDYLIVRIAENYVTVASFGISGRSLTLEGSVLFDITAEQDLPAVASRIASGIGGSPRIVLCLHPSLFVHRIVELPLTDLRKVREVLPAQLQGEIALPVETLIFDALPLSEGRYLALWARRTDISQAIDMFKEAGIEPAVVSAEPFSWCFLPGITADCALFDGSSLAIVANGGLSFVRAFSGTDRKKQLVATLSLMEMSSIALPARLFLFGEQAGSATSFDFSPLAVKTLEPPEDFELMFRDAQTFHQLIGSYAVARAIHAGTLPDFRRGDLAWTAGNVRLRKKLRLTVLLAIVLLLLLFAGKGLRCYEASKDVDSLNGSIFAVYRDIFPARTRAVDELAEIKGEIRKLTGSENSSGVLDLLKQLAEAKSAGINGLYEAELEGKTVRLKGDARSTQAVNEFKAALAPLMMTVEVGELKSHPDGGVTFSMAATLREGK